MRPRKYSVAVSALLCLIFGLLVSSPSSRVSAAPEYVLQFDGVDDRVTFGAAPSLGASTFTLELWFMRTGPGIGTSTGTGGLANAVPLLTKGMAEAETPPTTNMNYFLGIDAARRVLVADFEDTAGGVNHPVQGRTAICDNLWYHASATYDGTTWRLYLNGELEATLPVGAFTPQFASTQHAALGTALGTGGLIPSGQARGAFRGQIDEARIWGVARSQADIQATMGQALFAPQANLLGRWGLDDGIATTAVNSALPGTANGTLAPAVPTLPVWVAGGSGFVTGLVPGSDALRFSAPGDHVTFGAASPVLGASRFTVETWFKREAAGTGIGTGTSGLASVVPLVTKGRGEAEATNVDFNYFLGIRLPVTPPEAGLPVITQPVIAADFEEGATGASPGLNHPISGTTPIALGIWYHAAVTYDGTTLQLYLNGEPEGAPVVVGQPPRADSIMPVAFGTALNSTGAAAGFFAGSLDETRIWNYARNAAQMSASANREIPNGAGLLGRWSFNDCCGRVVDSTGHIPYGPPAVVGATVTGSLLQGTGWGWVPRGLPALSTAINQAPTVDAGVDHTITMPALSVLNGVVNDDTVATGTPLAIQWSKTSGPGLVAFGDATAPGSSVTFSALGTYVLTLTASDGELVTSDDVIIEVNGAFNLAPVVQAGADQIITLPTTAVALSAVVTDDGLPGPVTTAWSMVSGPGAVTFGDAAAAATSATFAGEGTYVLQLTASDGMLSGSDTLSVTVQPNATNRALQLGGTNAYATFGPAPQLGASTFTLEAWIRRDGAGVATFSGTGGVTAVPIITKGMAEGEGGSIDMNYFFGITPTTGRLAADFEDTATGLNHPINGTTAIPADGSWHHVAVTYDGTTWQLYLDGNGDGTLSVGAFTPRFDSIQHAAIGTALNSTGAVTSGQTAGRFNGVIDEVRIWNYARSSAQIQSGRIREIPAASGLLGRFGLNEGTGTSVASSVGVASGTIVGSNWSWVSGASMMGELNAAPVADAGPNQTVTLPASGVLVGSATDDGLSGTLVTALWSQVSGPGVAIFSTPASAITTVDFTALGTYVLRLKADDGELSGTDDVTIVVDGVVNLAPGVEAGANQTITLPAHVAALSGTVDHDGLPTPAFTTAWSKVSGAGTVTFGNAASLATTATFSMQGTYVLQLSASDGLLSGSDTVTVTVSADPANKAIDFGGTNAFVTLGPAAGLGASRFTVETWFRRDGAGVATNTGSGGVVAIPLVSKGMAEVDDINNRDMNYFLGIRQSDGVLVADFEDTATAGNHVVAGTTVIATGPAWRHAAVTYDGTTWRLYLDGQLERELVIGAFTPRFDSIQHAALGTALNSTGGVGSQAQGFFNGVLDEARIWNYARSAEQINRGRLIEIAQPTPGLLGRWGLNEGVGTSVGGPGGTVVGSAWSWVEGAPFTGANQAPVATDDTATTNEDAAATITVLGNDSDADGDALTLATVSAAAHGIATANADGTVSYTPAGNYSGPDSFSYTVSDSQGGSATAVVSVTVTEINDAPVAADDAATTIEDTAVAVAVLANDSDPEGGLLTPIVFNAPANGSVTVEAGGMVMYTPAADFNGTDSFTYTVTDGTTESGVATVTIEVQAVNDAPAVSADSYTLDEDATLAVPDPGVLGNDSDGEGDGLSATLATGPAHGALTLNADGSFIYTPDANYHGADSFTYRANDGAIDSTEATVVLTIEPVNDTPVAADNSYSTDEDTALVIAGAGVLANDSDVDADSLHAVLVSGPSHGAVTLNADGGFTYTPSANYNGADSFSYLANDGAADSNAAVVDITVNAVDDAPVAGDDTFTINEDTSLSASAPGVLANDTDVEGASLTAVLVSDVAHGTLTLNANGSFHYAPMANYDGSDSFTYRVSAGAAVSSVATVTITITGVADAPAAVDDHFSTDEDTVLDVPAAGVLVNDTDADNDALTALLVTGPSHGTVTLGAEGGFVYTPAADYKGADSFTYKARDGSTDSVATVRLTVNAVNDVSFANADSYTTAEDMPLVVAAPGVTANDTDIDGDTLTASVVTAPIHGTLALIANGSFVYTPASEYSGPDSFTYKLNDGTADSNVATVTLNVTAVDDDPTAGDNSYSTSEEVTLTVAAPGVLANDTHPDGSPMTAVLVSGVSHGTLTLSANGGFSYQGAANFHGTDSFTYRATDGTRSSNIATVTITISGANDAPRAVMDTYTLNEDSTLTIAAPGLLANDVDVDSPTLTVSRVTSPLRGTLTLNANGSFTYTPIANYNGPDLFIYRASDGQANSNLAVVVLNVKPVADAPVANNQSVSLNEDTVKQVVLSASDADGNNLTFTIVTPPAHGTLTGTLPNVTYRPAANYNGPDSFKFRASDGSLTSNVATVSITVAPVNDAPVAVAAKYTMPRNTTLTRQAGATDVDLNALTYAITTQPTKGTVTLNATTGMFTYKPATGKTGADFFQFRVNDGVTNSSPARIDVQIQ